MAAEIEINVGETLLKLDTVLSALSYLVIEHVACQEGTSIEEVRERFLAHREFFAAAYLNKSDDLFPPFLAPAEHPAE